MRWNWLAAGRSSRNSYHPQLTMTRMTRPQARTKLAVSWDWSKRGALCSNQQSCWKPVGGVAFLSGAGQGQASQGEKQLLQSLYQSTHHTQGSACLQTLLTSSLENSRPSLFLSQNSFVYSRKERKKKCCQVSRRSQTSCSLISISCIALLAFLYIS